MDGTNFVHSKIDFQGIPSKFSTNELTYDGHVIDNYTHAQSNLYLQSVDISHEEAIGSATRVDSKLYLISETTIELLQQTAKTKSITLINQIPKDLEEAALVDGCTGCGAFFHVTAPLAAPGIAATAIFCLIMSWDEFVYSFILSSEASKTLPVAIPTLITLFGAKWGQVTAVSVVTMVPVIILAMTIQRALVRGLTLGAEKG